MLFDSRAAFHISVKCFSTTLLIHAGLFPFHKYFTCWITSLYHPRRDLSTYSYICLYSLCCVYERF
jgi:hypothetical protein